MKIAKKMWITWFEKSKNLRVFEDEAGKNESID